MTKPPCYNTETHTDCPRRYVGCRASCDAWYEYLAIHEQEIENIRKSKNMRDDVEAFVQGQSKRKRLATHREYMRQKRR